MFLDKLLHGFVVNYQHIGVHQSGILLFYGKFLAAETAKVMNKSDDLAALHVSKVAHQFVIFLEGVLHEQHVTLLYSCKEKKHADEFADETRYGIV